jgi:poly(3-hydroxybutyrate) depolymerase
MLYTVIIVAGSVLAGIAAAFVIELLVVALRPNVSAPGQRLPEKQRPHPEEEPALSGKRQSITFEVEGTSISAWLYLPRGQSSPVPCIVMAHGLGGTKKMLEPYAVRL